MYEKKIILLGFIQYSIGFVLEKEDSHVSSVLQWREILSSTVHNISLAGDNNIKIVSFLITYHLN